VVKAIQNGRLPTLADFRGNGGTEKSSLSEAPPYVPARNGNGTPGTPSAGFSSPQQGASGQPLGRAGVAINPNSPIVQLNYEAPVASAGGPSTSFPQNGSTENRDFGSTGNRSNSQPQFARDNPVSPPIGGESSGTGTNVAQSALGSSQPSASAATNPDTTFKYVQDRLRQLGATYYLLEAWGDHKDAYRFYCQMAIGGNPKLKQSFQSIDADPLKAMANVLQQVEDWQKRG
jgi:hypothetical protein